jgi:hypothetical protein
MPDLFLGTVDYGPLYRALNQRQQSTQAALGLAGDILSFGKQVYELFEDTRFAEFQGRFSDVYTGFRSKVTAGVDSGAIHPNEQGQIVYDERIMSGRTVGAEEIGSVAKTLEEDFETAVGELAAEYRGNRKVQAFAKSNVKDFANGLIAKAQEEALAKYQGQREAIFKEKNYPEAIKQSIEQGRMEPFRDLISASGWLGSARQNALIEAGEKQVMFGIERRSAKYMAMEKGPEETLTWIDSQEASGYFTSDQANDLRKAAVDTGRAVLGTDAKTTVDAFDRDVQRLGPEGAFSSVSAVLRPSTKPDVEKILQAHKDAYVERRSKAATEAIQGYFAKNSRDPSGVLTHFLDPANGYSEAMDETRWRIWHNFLQSEVDALTRGPKIMSARELDFRKSFYWDSAVTDENLGKLLVDYVKQGRLQEAEAGNVLTDIPKRKNGIMFREITTGHARIDSRADGEIRKLGAKPDTKKVDRVEQQRTEWHNALDRFAIEGPQAKTAEEFGGYVDSLIRGEAPYLLFKDERPIGKGSQRQEARTRILAERQQEFLDTAQIAQWRETDSDIWTRELEVPKENIQAVETSNLYPGMRGLTAYAIKGLKPDQPDKWFLYRIGVDPATGMERPEWYAQTRDPRTGNIVDERWLPAGFIQMPEAREAQEQAAATAAERAKALAEEAAKPPIAPPKYRTMDEYLSSLGGLGGTVGEPELRVEAGKLGVSYERLREAAKNRGLQITRGRSAK